MDCATRYSRIDGRMVWISPHHIYGKNLSCPLISRGLHFSYENTDSLSPLKTLCFAFFDLCLHPDYLEPLRKEIEDTPWEAFDKSGGKLLPLMDSFLKESARLTPVESGMSLTHRPKDLFPC
jgi:hypothetical protein